ncbi:hypothetical protein [Klebsiella pasteurii]|uniref:hypothetical protein n=1 Tax=Klebsiella pasteurii TaxID=2587529 RepID=UPI0002FD971E|nr:hypothetical protein [Klebsiella pasteurii]
MTDDKHTGRLSSIVMRHDRTVMMINSLLNIRVLSYIAIVNIRLNPFFTHFVLNKICCNNPPAAILSPLKMK